MSCSSPQPDDTPSFIIFNARVITNDPHQPAAQAVVIAGNRIAYAGQNEQALAMRTHAARVINAQGNTLLPGFIDSHYHLFLGSAELGIAALDDVRSLEELALLLHTHAQKLPEAAWVCGSHLGYSVVGGGVPLNRHHLDAILPDRPVVLMAYDYHTAWANSRALALAGLLEPRTTDYQPGVVRGEDGLPLGELHEMAAYAAMMRHTGPWGRAALSLNNLPTGKITEEFKAADLQMLQGGLKLAARHGITSVHNMDGNLQQLELYQALEQQGELTTRIYLPLSLSAEDTPTALQEAAAMQQATQNSLLRCGLVKMFLDGVVESGTAYLVDDYIDAPGQRGQPLYTVEHFTQMVGTADRLGLQVAVHAIGDAAVRQALDGFETVQHANGVRDSRHRIEHIELVHPADMPRFAQLGVIASMQPLHVPTASGESAVWARRVGPSRWEHSFAWRSLRRAGARVIFGSDWPIVTSNPMVALKAALTRQPWLPGLPVQRQSLEEALASFTRLGAYAEFQEQQKGILKVGALADLVLLSADLASTAPAEFDQIRTRMTICDGRVVYEENQV